MDRIFYKIAIIMCIALTYVNSLNILAIFPYEGKSHVIVLREYTKELSKRGHNVTVISYYPEKDPPKNYRDIDLTDSSKQAVEGVIPAENSYRVLFFVANFLMYKASENCEVLLSNKEVQDLINDKPKFDLVVMEMFNSDCALGIAYKFNVPVVAITSHILMPYHYNRLGIQYNPSYVPHMFLEGGVNPTLYERVERVIIDFYIKSVFHYISQRSNQNTLAKYFDDIPPLEELAKEIKIVLLYQNFVLTGSRLLPSKVIEVGGYHVGKAKPLTGDLKKFVDEAEHGVIFISLGSMVRSSTLPQEKVDAIVGAINEFPQRFIWKWDDDTTEFAPKEKLFMSTWMPQVDILGHPKTLAFLSHGGLGGTTEAIHFGVPMVTMPIFGDQPSNAAAIEESGLGVVLHMRHLTKENLVAAFKKLLEPKFQEQVKQVSRAWHDRPQPPLDTAVFWTEFAARNANFTYNSASVNVPLYQYYNLDIAAIFLVIAVVLLVILKLLLSLCKSKKVSKRKVKKN